MVTEEYPKVKAEHVHKPGVGWSYIVKCPFCGGQHTHGAPNPNKTTKEALGLRGAHCFKGTYELVN